MFVIIATVGVLVFLLGCHRILGGKRRLPLPPGPPGEPLIGHLRVIPAEHPEFQYAQWAKEYNTEIRKQYKDSLQNITDFAQNPDY